MEEPYLGINVIAVYAVEMMGTTREPLVGRRVDFNPVAEVVPSADHLRCASALDADTSLGPEARAIDSLIQAVAMTIGERSIQLGR